MVQNGTIARFASELEWWINLCSFLPEPHIPPAYDDEDHMQCWITSSQVASLSKVISEKPIIVTEKVNLGRLRPLLRQCEQVLRLPRGHSSPPIANIVSDVISGSLAGKLHV